MISRNDGDKFINSIIDSDLLSNAISWINSNLSPDDVFSSEKLDEWASENGYKKDEEE